MLFKVLDYNKNPVILAKNTWYNKLLDSIFGHPEIKAFQKDIKITINKPDYVYASIHDPRSKLLIQKITKGEFASYFLVIVVKYVQEQEKTIGYISTVMINRRLPKGNKPLWERKVLT